MSYHRTSKKIDKQRLLLYIYIDNAKGICKDCKLEVDLSFNVNFSLVPIVDEKLYKAVQGVSLNFLRGTALKSPYSLLF